jgi:hypothetical protein
MNVVTDPLLTSTDIGLTVPPDPALAVIEYWFSVKVTLTVQSPAIGPVMYAFPLLRVPPQPVTLSIE